MKSEHKKQIELRDAAYNSLKNEYEIKVKEIENLKLEYECHLQSLTKRNEEYIQGLTNNYTVAQQVNVFIFRFVRHTQSHHTLSPLSYPLIVTFSLLMSSLTFIF
jgi:hypothetical protein